MVIPINRVKLHTDFVGPLQSGLCKMLVIGLGNQEGCSTIHERAPEELAATLEEAARLIMEQVNVGFGIGCFHSRSIALSLRPPLFHSFTGFLPSHSAAVIDFCLCGNKRLISLAVTKMAADGLKVQKMIAFSANS